LHVKEGKSVWQFPWQLFVSELVGTAALVLVGVPVVILMFGAGSPIPELAPNEALRRTLTGFVFGTTGALIALSRVGIESGAHINPAVTLGFWLMQKPESKTAVCYVLAQFIGAVVGSLSPLAWGAMGRSVEFGATRPSEGFSTGIVLLGEAASTFLLVGGSCVFLGFRHLHRFTSTMIPPLCALMGPLEAPISGNSMNPARTLGPALVSGK